VGREPRLGLDQHRRPRHFGASSCARSHDDEPADVVFAGSPERAFVSCSQANTVLVFDLANLAPRRRGSRSSARIRARWRSAPTGTRVYAAIFESGNRSTVLGGGPVTGTSASRPTS
jgi:hypothetical protein